MNIIYGWLWLVMAGYEVLFGFRYQIQAACRRPVMRRHITYEVMCRLITGRRQLCEDYIIIINLTIITRMLNYCRCMNFYIYVNNVVSMRDPDSSIPHNSFCD